MKDWIKWGLVGAAVGFVIEVIMLGYFNFFWLEPKLERSIGPLMRPFLGTTAFPGETFILTTGLYFISGILLWKISKYVLRRD